MADGKEKLGGPLTAVDKPTGRTLLVVGGLAAAIGAISCCVLPLALFALGISGAWIGNVTALAPYHLYFIAAAVVLLGLGFVRVYRWPRAECADEGPAPGPPRAALSKSRSGRRRCSSPSRSHSLMSRRF